MPPTAPSGRSSLLRSAEAIVALALLAVCLAVGGAYWLMTSRDSKPPSVNGSANDAPTLLNIDRGPDEQTALENWNRKLQGDFAQIDQQRKLQDQHSDRKYEDAVAQATYAKGPRTSEHTPEAEPVLSGLPPPAPSLPAPPPQVATATQPSAPSQEAKRVAASVDWTSCRRPEYPQHSVRYEEQGVVVLAFDIDAQGKVLHGAIANSSGSTSLDEAALHALGKCRFKPAILEGTAVASEAKVQFQWRLR